MGCGCNKGKKNSKAVSKARRRISNKPMPLVKIKRTTSIKKTTTKKK